MSPVEQHIVPPMPDGLAEMHSTWFQEDLVHPQRVLPDSVPIDAFLESEKIRGELTKLARHDQLTGLLNRHGLDEELRTMFADKEHKPRVISALSLDFNEFKKINDEKGHPEGDRAMQQWVYQIKERLQPNDIFARTGGDEFTILRVHSNEEVEQAKTNGINICDATDIMGHDLARQMNDALFMYTGDGPRPITASIGGICIIEPKNIGEVYFNIGKRSDDAMYRAKRTAKSEKKSTRIHGLLPSIYYRQGEVDLNVNVFSGILSRITHACTSIFSRR